MGSDKGSGHSKVKEARKDPGGDEFLNSCISYWQYNNACEPADRDPLFLKVLRKDALYEKAIPVLSSLQCEGMCAIYVYLAMAPQQDAQSAGRGTALQPQQHQSWVENEQFGLVLKLLFSSAVPSCNTTLPSPLQALAKQAKSNKPTKVGFKCGIKDSSKSSLL